MSRPLRRRCRYGLEGWVDVDEAIIDGLSGFAEGHLDDTEAFVDAFKQVAVFLLALAQSCFGAVVVRHARNLVNDGGDVSRGVEHRRVDGPATNAPRMRRSGSGYRSGLVPWRRSARRQDPREGDVQRVGTKLPGRLESSVNHVEQSAPDQPLAARESSR